MKWLFVKRSEQNSACRMQHYFGKLSLKASYWAGRASTRTLAMIPNYSTLIIPCILWLPLYSSNVAREHQVWVTVQGAGMLTQHAREEGKEALLIPSNSSYQSLGRHLSLSLKDRALNEAFKRSVMGGNNGNYCRGTSKGKVHRAMPQHQMGRQHAWKQKKGTVRELGRRSNLQTAARTTACFLGTCYGSSRLATVCSRKNPKLPQAAIVTEYLWSLFDLGYALN